MKKIVALVLTIAMLLGFAAPSLADQDGYFTALLMGMDEGAQEAIVEGGRFGRSDAMMLVSLNKATGDIRLLSVERDYRTDILDNGANKLCVVSYFAGPEVSLEAVNKLFNIDISCYAAIDPEGMENIADALGGVEIDISKDDLYIRLDDGKGTGKKAFKKAGVQQCNGAQVRALVRTRVRPDGVYEEDVVRNARQKKALTAMMEKALSGGRDKLLSFGTAAFRSVTTNISLPDLLGLAEPLIGGKLNAPQFERSPITGYSYKNVKLHKLVELDDPDLEIAAVKAFLYPTAFEAPTPAPTLEPTPEPFPPTGDDPAASQN